MSGVCLRCGGTVEHNRADFCPVSAGGDPHHFRCWSCGERLAIGATCCPRCWQHVGQAATVGAGGGLPFLAVGDRRLAASWGLAA